MVVYFYIIHKNLHYKTHIFDRFNIQMILYPKYYNSFPLPYLYS